MINIKETIRFHHNKRNLTTIFCFESFCSLQVVPSKTTKFTLKENTHIAFPRTIQLQFHCQPGIIPFHYIFSLESSLHIVFPPGIIPSRSIFSLESFLHVLFSAWNDSVRRRQWCCGWCSRWWFGHQLPTDQSTFAEGRRDKGRSTPSAKSWRRGPCVSVTMMSSKQWRSLCFDVSDVVVGVVQDYDVSHAFRPSSSVLHYACMYVLRSHLSVLHLLSCSFSIFRKLGRTCTTYDPHQYI